MRRIDKIQKSSKEIDTSIKKLIKIAKRNMLKEKENETKVMYPRHRSA